MQQPEEEKIAVGFEAANMAKAHRSQAERLDEIASLPRDDSVRGRRAAFEMQVAPLTEERHRSLLAKIKMSEQSRQRLLNEKQGLIGDHINSIRRSERQLLQLEVQLPGFKNDSGYAEYTSTQQAAMNQLNALEISLGDNPPPKRDSIKQSVLVIWRDYEFCYSLLRQFLAQLEKASPAQQALNINLQGAQIKDSAGAKIQTFVIQTEKGTQNVVEKIKQIGVLEAKIKEKDHAIAGKDKDIADLRKELEQRGQAQPEAHARAQQGGQAQALEDAQQAVVKKAVEEALQKQAIEHATQMEKKKAEAVIQTRAAQKQAEQAAKAEAAQGAAYELERERQASSAAAKQRVAQGLSKELVLACEQGDEKAVEDLLLRGADPILETKEGVHRLGAAVWGMNREIVNQLTEAMGGVASLGWE